MSVTITVHEKANIEDVAAETRSLKLPTDRISARELIRSHVYESVMDHNLRCTNRAARNARDAHRVERALNSTKRRTPGEVDWRRAFESALEAFQRRRILLLVDDHQVEDIDQSLELSNESVVTFLRLLPLAGG